jgi:hypothetical protein
MHATCFASLVRMMNLGLSERCWRVVVRDGAVYECMLHWIGSEVDVDVTYGTKGGVVQRRSATDIKAARALAQRWLRAVLQVEQGKAEC